MKNSLATISLFIFLSNLSGFCQSKIDSDAGSKISGSYQVARITIFTDGKPTQDADMSGTIRDRRASTIITANRKAESVVTLRLHQYQDTTCIMTFLYGDTDLRTSSTGYDLYLRGEKIGMTDGDSLTIDMSTTSQQTNAVRRSLMKSVKQK